jgi:hypothetical protein
MADNPPSDGLTEDNVRRFEFASGVEVIVHGDEFRTHLAQRVMPFLLRPFDCLSPSCEIAVSSTCRLLKCSTP